jgi:hypothetical protein
VRILFAECPYDDWKKIESCRWDTGHGDQPAPLRAILHSKQRAIELFEHSPDERHDFLTHSCRSDMTRGPLQQGCPDGLFKFLDAPG